MGAAAQANPTPHPSHVPTSQSSVPASREPAGGDRLQPLHSGAVVALLPDRPHLPPTRPRVQHLLDPRSPAPVSPFSLCQVATFHQLPLWARLCPRTAGGAAPGPYDLEAQGYGPGYLPSLSCLNSACRFQTGSDNKVGFRLPRPVGAPRAPQEPTQGSCLGGSHPGVPDPSCLCHLPSVQLGC